MFPTRRRLSRKVDALTLDLHVLHCRIAAAVVLLDSGRGGLDACGVRDVWQALDPAESLPGHHVTRERS
jgi:hypothetical protein